MLRVPGIPPTSGADAVAWGGREKPMEGDTRVRRTMVFVAAVLAAGVFVFAGAAQARRPGTGAIREATLTDAQVVPGPGDSGGSGEARFIFYPNKHKICYMIQVSGIDRATSAHLHEAPASQVGPVKLRLNPPRDETSEHECIRGLGERYIKRISGNPTGYYVDVRNAAFTDGAVRGQLTQGGPR
jgi:CHRD domain-containing protein